MGRLRPMTMIQSSREKFEADQRRRKLYDANETNPTTQPTMTTAYRARRVEEAAFRNSTRLPMFKAGDYEALSSVERLDVLIRYASVLKICIGYTELRKRRRSFNSCKNTKFPLFDGTGTPYPCWVCKIHDAKHRHHVILLRNGGEVTGKKNVVLLCEGCHVQIHPWMHENSVVPVAAATFELQRAKVASSDILERASKGKYPTMEGAEAELLALLHSVFNKLRPE